MHPLRTGMIWVVMLALLTAGCAVRAPSRQEPAGQPPAEEEPAPQEPTPQEPGTAAGSGAADDGAAPDPAPAPQPVAVLWGVVRQAGQHLTRGELPEARDLLEGAAELAAANPDGNSREAYGVLLQFVQGLTPGEAPQIKQTLGPVPYSSARYLASGLLGLHRYGDDLLIARVESGSLAEEARLGPFVYDWKADWFPSPDGASITFARPSGREGTRPHEIIVARADGSEQRVIGEADYYWAAWAPDSYRIAYTSLEGLFLTDRDGSAHRLLAAREDYRVPARVYWLPEAPERLLHSHLYYEGSGEAVVRELESGAVRELGLATAHSVSPDGALYLFSGSGLYDVRTIGVSRVDTGEAIAEIPGATGFGAWSPDGEHLAAALDFNLGEDTRPGAVWLLDLSTGRWRLLWAPDGIIHSLDWSPDGELAVLWAPPGAAKGAYLTLLAP